MRRTWIASRSRRASCFRVGWLLAVPFFALCVRLAIWPSTLQCGCRQTMAGPRRLLLGSRATSDLHPGLSSLLIGVLRSVRKQRQVTGSFDRPDQLPLMLGASTCPPARQDLPPPGDKTSQELRILVIYLDSINTKRADMLIMSSETWTSAAAPLGNQCLLLRYPSVLWSNESLRLGARGALPISANALISAAVRGQDRAGWCQHLALWLAVLPPTRSWPEAIELWCSSSMIISCATNSVREWRLPSLSSQVRV